MRILQNNIGVIILIMLLLENCSNGSNYKNHIASYNEKDTLNFSNPIKKEPSQKLEKKLTVKFKTKLVEWGGDGKWHDMYKNDNDKYWVNYSDPFKIILSGAYSGLSIKLKSSSGSIIYDKTNVKIPENGEYIIANEKMVGENETIFDLEIKEDGNLIFKSKIESVPGGE